MPFDAVFLSAVTEELRGEILGASVDKVLQPARDTVILVLRGSRRLLINVGTGSARISLTRIQADNPPQPPMFCMLLRKHLVGGKITELEQLAGDRIVRLRIRARDTLGVECERLLIAELMGRNSNLILTDEEGIVLDALRRVPGVEEAARPLLPGLRYRNPPSQAGTVLGELDPESIRELVRTAPPDRAVTDWLRDAFRGLSPLLCRELSYRAAGDTDARIREEIRASLAEALIAFRDETPAPWLLLDEKGDVKDFAATPIRQYGGAWTLRKEESFSDLMDTFYRERDTRSRITAAAHEIHRTAKTARDRVRRRLNEQRKEYAATEDRDTLRENGDLITANLWQMKKGMRVLQAEDFYSEEEGAIREIPLDPLKTPQQNAARYYKDYNRAKTARRILTGEIEKGEAELSYLESVLEELDRAESLSELGGIRQELETGGWLKSQGGRRKPQGEKSAPPRYRTESGLTITVGRNNLENDRLTLKTAHKGDLWFHVKDLHGSHVILSTEGREPDADSIRRAAGLAAWFSQGRDAGKVAVDMTHVGNVKKPSGALPGRVIYTGQETLYVAPDPAEDCRIK